MKLYRFKKNIYLNFDNMWIPAPRGNKGNKSVYALAKQALKHEIMNISLSKSEAKGITKRNLSVVGIQETQDDVFMLYSETDS